MELPPHPSPINHFQFHKKIEQVMFILIRHRNVLRVSWITIVLNFISNWLVSSFLIHRYFLLSTFSSSTSFFSRSDPRHSFPIQLSSQTFLQGASLINSIACSPTPILKRLIQNPWFIDLVLLIFMQMWSEYLDLLNVGKHLFKFSDCCQPYGS